MFVETFGPLGIVPSDFIIVTGQPTGKKVCPIIQSYPEVIIDMADDWQIFLASISIFPIAVNR